MAKIMQLLQLIKIHKIQRKSQHPQSSWCCTVFWKKIFFSFATNRFFYHLSLSLSLSLFVVVVRFLRCTTIASVSLPAKKQHFSFFLSFVSSKLLFRCLVFCLLFLYLCLTADIRHFRRFVRWAFVFSFRFLSLSLSVFFFFVLLLSNTLSLRSQTFFCLVSKPN